MSSNPVGAHLTCRARPPLLWRQRIGPALAWVLGMVAVVVAQIAIVGFGSFTLVALAALPVAFGVAFFAQAARALDPERIGAAGPG